MVVLKTYIRLFDQIPLSLPTWGRGLKSFAVFAIPRIIKSLPNEYLLSKPDKALYLVRSAANLVDAAFFVPSINLRPEKWR